MQRIKIVKRFFKVRVEKRRQWMIVMEGNHSKKKKKTKNERQKNKENKKNKRRR